MSKELLAGLDNVQAIQSLTELSILMEAVVVRLRELAPDEEHISQFNDQDEKLVNTLLARLDAFQKGKAQGISRQDFMKNIREKLAE